MQADGTGTPSANFEPARLAEISGGDLEFEREITGEYLTQAYCLFEEAAQALVSRDAAALRRAAHTLKGSSRTVGAEGVAVLAGDLEAAAASSTSGLAPLLASALACLIASERELDRYFDARGGRMAA